MGTKRNPKVSALRVQQTHSQELGTSRRVRIGRSQRFQGCGCRALTGEGARRGFLGSFLEEVGWGRSKRRQGIQGGADSPSKGAAVGMWKQDFCMRWGPGEQAWTPGHVPQVTGCWSLGSDRGGFLLKRPASSAGAQTPASPARCLGAPCRPPCPCACASSTGAACAATSPSGTSGTRSSQPSVPAAATSGERDLDATPGQGTPWGCTWAHGACCPPTVAAGPSRWLASVSTWCRRCPWPCTTSAGSPR